MKKILLFTSILVLSLSFVKAQSIDAVLITSPILCFGDFADIEVGITQTSPSTALNYVVEFSNTGSFYFQIAIAPLPPSTTFGTVQPFPNLASGYYRIKIKDAALIVLDSYDIYIPQPDPLSAIATQLDSILCNGNCTAKDSIAISGGTHPYTLTLNSGQPETLNYFSADTTYSNLCEGNYTVVISDSNGCPETVSFTINEPSLLISNLSILDHNGQDISCFEGSDGQITANVTGGVPGYTYSINGGAFSSDNVFTDLIAGTYSVVVSDVIGCSKSSSIVVNEPNALSVSFIMDSISCPGGADGRATVQVSGGVPGYNYFWDNGSNLNIADNLSAGYLSVTITDSSGCILIDSINIFEENLSIKIDSLIVSEMTCYDAGNASITVSATGGYPPLMYSSNNGLVQQSTNGFPNVGPNTYIMYVQDSRGCIDRDTVEIVNPDSLYIDTTVFSHVQCYGLDNASIQAISAFGGNSPYEYSVNFGAHHTNMAYFNVYGPGTYNIQVFDVNNCVAQDIIIITEPDELDVSIITSEWNSYQIKCFGDASGFADITVNGGTHPYLKTVLDNNGDTVISSFNSNITGLMAGAYTFLIMDANGCTYTETIIYNEPSVITHNFIATHVTCDGWNNGSLTDVVSGGVGTATTYIYTWSPGGSNTYSLTSIPIGTYTMTVVDNNNCVSVDSFIINDNNALNITTVATPVTCYNYCDGIIVATATGGTPNINSSGLPVYAYQWNDVLLQTTASAIGLCVDNTANSTAYICVVTDGQGCTDTIEYLLNQPEELIVTASIVNEISCNLGNDGQLTAIVTGGNGGTTYLWNTGTNFTVNPVNNNLSEDSYVVVAKDVKGCIDTTEIYLGEPLSALSVSLIETDVTCFGRDDGKITATAIGGTVIGIQEYNYNWTSGLNEQVVISTATDLAPNIYTVTVTDDKGCTITSETVYITQPANPLSILVDSTDETCEFNNGIAEAFVLGGTMPYTYDWSNSSTTNPIANLSAGLYTVDVTDANGCTISDETFVNGVQNIFLPGNVSSIDTAICSGRSVSLPIEVKPTLTYMWLYNTDTIYQSNSVNYIDIVVTPTDPVNVYTLYITDPTCALPYTVTATISVNAAEVILSTNNSSYKFGPHYQAVHLNDTIFNVDGSYDIIQTSIHTVAITNGTFVELFSDNNNCDTYDWTWEDGNSSTQSISTNPSESGWYYVAVDSLGCLGFDSVYVVVGVGAPTINGNMNAIYDAITPNGDTYNDDWKIPGIEYYPNALIQVFNRWGSIVHETSGSDYDAWNGTNEGEELPVGTYYYIIDLKTDDVPQTGPITIIR